MINMIVELDSNRGIGYQGKIPWRIPADMKHFQRTTTGHAVIMGRLTWESIGRPLSSRRNIIVSKTLSSLREIEVVSSLEEAFKLTDNNAYIIGGGQLYEAAFPFTQLIVVSHIKGIYPADTFFPNISPSEWEGTFNCWYPDFDVCTYVRRQR
jgi:dihydrofolate reductase